MIRLRMMASDNDSDILWLQAKLKAAVAQEDYAGAAQIKARIEELGGATQPPNSAEQAPPSPPPPSPLAAQPSVRMRRHPKTINSDAVRYDQGAAATSSLEEDGIVRLNGVISPQVASEVLLHVNDSLKTALRDVQDKPVHLWETHFGNVLSRSNRYDIKLSLKAPPVRDALECMLKTLEPIIARSLGEDAELYELAALISLPGAARQPVHPDTPITPGKGTDGNGPTILTAFCALQDIDGAMGPTLFLPATHNEDAHSNFFTYDNFDLAFSAAADDDDEGGADEIEQDRSERLARVAALLDKWSTWRGELSTGDVSLFDSRCLHAGEANTSERQRVLFYCSFIRAAHADACDGTLLESLRGKHTLSELAA